MAKRSPRRRSRAWQVESVWVKRREGPERVLSAYRLLLDLPPRRFLGVNGPRDRSLRQDQDPVAGEGVTATASFSPSGNTSL